MKKIIIASDHAGYSLKEYVKKFLLRKKLLFKDVGTKNDDRVDYPDFAKKLDIFSIILSVSNIISENISFVFLSK